MLPIYVLVALIHMATIIIGGSSSNAWNRPGELIALAVNSTPTKLLENTCAGIEDPKTWTRIMSVQETGEAHLETVFDKDRRSIVDSESQGVEIIEGQSTTNSWENKVRRYLIPEKQYRSLK
jgi:hypothetical protein